MNRLIHDLLDVVRMEAGQLHIHQIRVPAALVAADAVDVHSARAASASSGLQLAVSPEIPEV